jgi:hypothetical protein
VNFSAVTGVSEKFDGGGPISPPAGKFPAVTGMTENFRAEAAADASRGALA